MTVAVKNWTRFQHFKDRKPPWIKLYRDLLDDPDWHDLSGDDAKALVMIWLIASEDEDRLGRLPDSRRLAFRLRITQERADQLLDRLSRWLANCDELISSRYQDDAPETEIETETNSKETDSKYSKESESEDRFRDRDRSCGFRTILRWRWEDVDKKLRGANDPQHDDQREPFFRGQSKHGPEENQQRKAA